MNYATLDGAIAVFPSFDTLPQPEQVAALVPQGRPISSTAVADGKTNVTIGVPAR